MNLKHLCPLFILFIPIFSFSQEQLSHKKKMYQSPEGKLYINKELPIYLRIASSPDEDADSYLLKSDDSKKYTNPMYFDTEGYNSIRSPWKVDPETGKVIYPKEDIIFEIYADSKPPVTKIQYGTNDLFQNNDKIFLGKATSISLTQYDAISGVEAIYYSLDKSSYQQYSDPIKLNEEKEYVLKYYAVDHVGNVEAPHTVNLVLDQSDPTTQHKISGDQYENIISERSEIALVAKDNGSDIKNTFYTIDQGSQKIYSNSLKGKYLSEGEHQISYYSVDHVGNQEKKKTYTFYVDKTPPTVVDELIGNTFVANGKEYFSGRNKLKLISMDNKAGVKEIRYSINNGEFKTYEKPFYLSKSGNLKIETFAIDNVNNRKRTERLSSRSNISYVDLSGPELGHRFEGPSFVSKDTTFISRKTQIYLSGNDGQSGMKKITYRIGKNGSYTEYKEPFSIEKEGIYTISYTGYDQLDNTNTKQFLCIVDNSGPKIYNRFSIDTEKQKMIDNKNIPAYPNHVVLFLSSTDYYVGFDKMYYQINNSQKQLYKSLIEGFKEETLYQLSITAIDKLGNESESNLEFYIE